MITSFVTVYPGHIDFPDHGQVATPANERRYSNEQLASVFEKTEAVAKVMDKGGWDALWLAEHHFQPEGYEVIPNPLMVAVHLAHVNLSTPLTMPKAMRVEQLQWVSESVIPQFRRG